MTLFAVLILGGTTSRDHRPAARPRTHTPCRRAGDPPAGPGPRPSGRSAVPHERHDPVRRAARHPLGAGQRRVRRLLLELPPHGELPRHRRWGSSSGATRAGVPISPFGPLLFAVVLLVTHAQINVQLGSPDELFFGSVDHAADVELPRPAARLRARHRPHGRPRPAARRAAHVDAATSRLRHRHRRLDVRHRCVQRLSALGTTPPSRGSRSSASCSRSWASAPACPWSA